MKKYLFVSEHEKPKKHTSQNIDKKKSKIIIKIKKHILLLIDIQNAPLNQDKTQIANKN